MEKGWFMIKSFRFYLLLSVAFCFFATGCGDQVGVDNGSALNAPSETSDDASDPDETTSPAVPEVDDSPLDVDNPETPEGVVNEFFKTFFSGDDEGAFALLTSRAQEAKREQFAAQESNTVRWRITKKMKPIRGRVLVQVDVEDYTDSGAIQMDELTFVLTNVDFAWRIAGFSVGDLAINFEDSLQEMIAQEETQEPTKTARVLDDEADSRKGPVYR